MDEKVSLRPLEVYDNAVHLMKVLASHGWHRMLERPIVMSSSVDPQAVQVSVYPLMKPGRPTDFLEIDIAVAGLYQAGINIAERNAFYKQDTLMLINDDLRGSVLVYPLHTQGPDFPPPPDFDNYSPEYVGTGLSSPTFNVDQGRITDPKDKKFSFTFVYDGVKIRSADVFTFFAITAKNPDILVNAFVPAAPSASGDVILSTWVVGREKEKDLMTWMRLRRALLMTWGRIVKEDGGVGRKPRFEGWTIWMEYDGVQIGAARLLKFDSKGERSGDRDIAKRHL